MIISALGFHNIPWSIAENAIYIGKYGASQANNPESCDHAPECIPVGIIPYSQDTQHDTAN